MVYEREGEYLQAEAALQNVVHLSSEKDPESLFLLCTVKFALEKTDQARALAQQVSGLAGNDPRPLYAVGRLLRENGHATQGGVELERAHRLAPGILPSRRNSWRPISTSTASERPKKPLNHF
jgi:hypothetical protein